MAESQHGAAAKNQGIKQLNSAQFVQDFDFKNLMPV
jgi:hypothetical protein